ncbi:MAG TPA: hypothetical protein VF522_09740 [Ramlibacter sp.]|uniref:hypothetical protein n=1 Tax=Ramlibacter sp. TaxID=1917967 RepID=UPI002ED4B972
MIRSFLAAAGAAAVLLLAGCATPTRMAFHDDAQRLDAASKPVLLMATTIKNQYRLSFQPRLIVVHVERPDAKDAKDRINFTMDDKAKVETVAAEQGNTYLLRMELEPGRYEIRGLTSMGGGFPIVGSFFTPLHVPIEVKEKGVYYVGHVRATVRERQGNEFRAGAPIPLIDQAVIGASGGTFDVDITDTQPADEVLFRQRFPALKDAPISKAMLPAFDRAKAQDWWEKH